MNSGLSIYFYRLLMHAYPDSFRRRFGASVDQAFRDMMRDNFQRHGYLGLAILWFHVIPDFLFSTVELLTRKAGDFLTWRFRLQWVIACSLGFALSRCVALMIGMDFYREMANYGKLGVFLRTLQMPTVLMLCLTVVQSRVLAGRCVRKKEWVLYGLAGGVLALVVLQPLNLVLVVGQLELLQRIGEAFGSGLPRILAERVVVSIPMTLFGAITGALQWAAIRNDAISRYRWMVVCAAGYFLSAVAGGFVIPYPFFSVLNLVLTSVVAGAFLGLVTSGPLEEILFNVQAESRERS
jgi:hypothetical protein